MMKITVKENQKKKRGARQKSLMETGNPESAERE